MPNVDQCKQMVHIGTKNLSCPLMGSKLAETDQESGLEVTLDSLMKMSIHCAAAVKKKNVMFGIVIK